MLLVVLGGTGGCEQVRRGRPPPPASSASTGPVASPSAEPPPVESTQAESMLAATYRAALAQIAQAQALPSLPGAATFESRRAMLVGRAKSEPVFFVQAPQQPADIPVWQKALRTRFETTDFPWRELRTLMKRYKRDPTTLRALLLPDGYLYAERPDHAFSLVSLLKPRHLFDEQGIWVHRGELVMTATRNHAGDYVYDDGPEQGRVVRLLHLDRVGASPEIPAPLHRDFRSLRYRLYFERARIVHIGTEHLVAELKYENQWVTTLLQTRGARLEPIAEAIEPSRAPGLAQARERLRLRTHLVAQLRNAMRAQIEEALPFDEPKTEVGQQDGSLRPEWLRAYKKGATTFEFNEDRYPVFDRDGRPRPPQVCLDFMVDTLERASGTWWAPSSSGKREQLQGRLNLRSAFASPMRRTTAFIRFALDSPEWFDVKTFPESERIELGYKETFFRWLERRADQFEPGDMVFIRGLTPWDEIDEHTHSFYVYESDPLTGIPIAIAGNAGPANLWSLETEARRTPNRTLRDRIRPKTRWLETFLDIDLSVTLSAPPLVTSR